MFDVEELERKFVNLQYVLSLKAYGNSEKILKQRDFPQHFGL